MILHENSGALIDGTAAAQQSVRRTLLTPVGARAWEPAYGSTLLSLAEQPDTLEWRGAIETEVSRVVREYVGQPQMVDVEDDDDELVLTIVATTTLVVRIPRS